MAASGRVGGVERLAEWSDWRIEYMQVGVVVGWSSSVLECWYSRDTDPYDRSFAGE